MRKTTSKLGPSLQLFSQVDVLLAKGRNLDVIAQVERLGSRLPVEDLERTAQAGLVAELAERVTEDRHPLDGLYELTARALERLATAPDPRPDLAYFLSTALQVLGYGIQVGSCASCGKQLRPEPATFSPSAGGFLCARCSDPALMRVSLPALKVLRVLGSGDVELYRRLKLDDALLSEVESVLELQLEFHLERRLKSLQILKQLRGEHARAAS